MIYAEIFVWVLMCCAYVAHVVRQVRLKRIKDLGHMSISDHVAVLMNLVLLGVAVFALQISVIAYEDAHKSGDDQIKALTAARQAIIDTGAQQVQAVNSARSALDAVADQFRLEQRAWVGPVGVNPFEIKTEQNWPELTVIVRNNGKTPALNFTSDLTAIMIKKEETFQPKFPTPQEPRSIDVLQPNMEMFLKVATKPHKVSDANILALKAGDMTLYIFGKLSYDDVFGSKHLTTFCVYVASDLKSAITCKTYNDTN